YRWNGTDITIFGGFIKGIQKSDQGEESLVLRSLSPLPIVEMKASNGAENKVSITLENINPDYYAQSIQKGFFPIRSAVNTLAFSFTLKAGEIKKLDPTLTANTESSNYVILGDNRDGYDTFDQIIDQVNALRPAFVIDNGDLVFSGKPNQYRAFDRAICKLSTTLCTSLGNHDIRRGGREIYTKLYGPGYYSFDFGNSHFAFLDSSPGWLEKQAISEEQYAWLERDLKKAQGRKIFVITHVPPEDPRSGTQPNNISAYIDKVKKEGGFIEEKLDAYVENESMNHGFQDKSEALRFENLMTKYKVNTAYLSHIHSYYNFSKNGVRYIISGGAGAELLTKNSYYHYLISKTDNANFLTMVELPSPKNTIIKRYLATAALFADAMFVENRAAVISFLVGLFIFAALLLLLFYIKFKHGLILLWTLLKDTGRFMRKRFGKLKTVKSYNKE
ncbi:MAG: metallophosphoesterase, partial [Caproiciproducens sp.]|nr:metallophosphoesterase [Caproiciproducens sp.]